MSNSEFYTIAMSAFAAEIQKIEDFTEGLERDPEEKRRRIGEYKSEKCRYAGIIPISNGLYFCNKYKSRLCDSHYLLERFEELVLDDVEFLKQYEEADDEKKPDFALYYGMRTYGRKLWADKEEKLKNANDFERVELQCYIEGHKFAMDCLEAAWNAAYPKAYSAVEIEKALADIAISMYDSCRQRIEVLSPDARTEKKAILIEQGMYSMGIRAGLLYNLLGDREAVLQSKCRRFAGLAGGFPRALKAFEEADDREKLRITAALYGEIWLYGQYHVNNVEDLREAKKSGDVQKVFETTVKVKAMEALLSAWREWRRVHGVYPDILEEE